MHRAAQGLARCASVVTHKSVHAARKHTPELAIEAILSDVQVFDDAIVLQNDDVVALLRCFGRAKHLRGCVVCVCLGVQGHERESVCEGDEACTNVGTGEAREQQPRKCARMPTPMHTKHMQREREKERKKERKKDR